MIQLRNSMLSMSLLITLIQEYHLLSRTMQHGLWVILDLSSTPYHERHFLRISHRVFRLNTWPHITPVSDLLRLALPGHSQFSQSQLWLLSRATVSGSMLSHIKTILGMSKSHFVQLFPWCSSNTDDNILIQIFLFHTRCNFPYISASLVLYLVDSHFLG